MSDQEKPWNFLIAYVARQGSSAIISTLSKQNGINVPLFEDLDWYAITRNFDRADIYTLLRQVYNTGQFPVETTFDNYIALREPGYDYSSIGFKWNMFGNRNVIARILSENRVKLFFLIRSDFDELVCSGYTHQVMSASEGKDNFHMHPQFLVAQSSSSDRENILTKYRGAKPMLDTKILLEIAKKEAFGRISRSLWQLKFAFAGVKTERIYYEDFCADNEAFIRDFLSRLNIMPDTINTDSFFERVFDTPHVDRIEGVDKVIKSKRYRFFRTLYRLFS